MITHQGISKPRLLGLFFLFILLFLTAWGKLFVIQIVRSPFFSTIGAQQWQSTQLQLPPRATIYDRNGIPVALNKDSIAAFIVPRTLKNPAAMHLFLRKHFPAAHERLLQNPHAHFLYIKRRLTPDEENLLRQQEELHFLKEPSRFYPFACLGSLIGIADNDNHGLFGFELLYELQLAGEPRMLSLEKDAHSETFCCSTQPGSNGSLGTPLHLTIDSDLQFLVHEALKDQVIAKKAASGMALILEPTTGEIFAMTSYPSFDPHETQQLNLELTKNRCYTDSHEFGSVMKAFFALAALEEGIVTPTTPIDCGNIKEGFLDGIKLSTWCAEGIIPFSQVISRSNNFGTSKVARQLGPKLYHYYRRCGFGQKTNIHLLGEASGFVNPPEKWSKQSPFSLSFGYEINATLLQLAVAFSMLVNGGYLITPQITMPVQQQNSTPRFQPATLEAMRSILEQTVNEGTARRAQIPGYTVRGKTGTAKIIVNGAYSDRCMFTFIASIEKGSYKRVIAISLYDINDKHAFASTVAVPLFQTIAQKLLLHDASQIKEEV